MEASWTKLAGKTDFSVRRKLSAIHTRMFLTVLNDLIDVISTPLAQQPQHSLERPAKLSERILNPRRHFRIHLSLDDAIAFKFA